MDVSILLKGVTTKDMSIQDEIINTVDKLKKLSEEDIVQDRYSKFRNMGEFRIGDGSF